LKLGIAEDIPEGAMAAEEMSESENLTTNIMHAFLGEGAFQKSTWAVGTMYVVRIPRLSCVPAVMRCEQPTGCELA